MDTSPAAELESISSALLWSLRSRDGLDEEAFRKLLACVDKCAHLYAGQPGIPKEIAALFFDIYPAFVSASYLYEPAQTAKIQESAEQLADRIRSCIQPTP